MGHRASEPDQSAKPPNNNKLFNDEVLSLVDNLSKDALMSVEEFALFAKYSDKNVPPMGAPCNAKPFNPGASCRYGSLIRCCLHASQATAIGDFEIPRQLYSGTNRSTNVPRSSLSLCAQVRPAMALGLRQRLDGPTQGCARR